MKPIVSESEGGGLKILAERTGLPRRRKPCIFNTWEGGGTTWEDGINGRVRSLGVESGAELINN